MNNLLDASIKIDQYVNIGRPESTIGRLKKEVRVYDVLDEIGIRYVRVDHAAAATMEGCREVDRILGITICKNLFLCDRQMQNFYLLMMPAEKRFRTAVFSKLIGSSRLSFGPEEYMQRFLDVTPGSVSVMGLMNDKDNRVKLYIDADVLKKQYVGCHPCINTTSLRFESTDLINKFLPYVNHNYTTVELPWE